MTLAATLGANVRRHRLAAGMTPSQLGHRAGMTAVMLTATEEGRHGLVSLVDVEKLAQVLGCHPLDLMVDPVSDEGPTGCRAFGLSVATPMDTRWTQHVQNRPETFGNDQ